MTKIEISIKAFMDWISRHSGEIITLIIVGIGQLAAYLDLKFNVREHGRKIEKTEKVIENHVASPTLHRTPDFEQAQSEIKNDMTRINDKLDRILERLPRGR